jgi:hypothetical protein
LGELGVDSATGSDSNDFDRSKILTVKFLESSEELRFLTSKLSVSFCCIFQNAGTEIQKLDDRHLFRRPLILIKRISLKGMNILLYSKKFRIDLEKIRLKQYVSLRSKGKHNYFCYLVDLHKKDVQLV